MKRILYFDCFSGISGDMILGALIDLGLDPAVVEAELAKLNLPGYHLKIVKVKKYAISGTDVDVILEDCSHSHNNNHAHHGHDHAGNHHSHCNHEHNHQHNHGQETDAHSHSNGTGHHHDHEHTDDHHSHAGHNHSQTSAHDHSHSHAHTHHHTGADHHHEHSHERNLADITALIAASAISAKAKALTLAIFQEIAQAEGKVHGMTPDEVHFHEVGAVDSIVDITGAAICLDLLGIDEVHCSPVQDGHGFVTCQHGRLPVPVPAVAEMMAGSSVTLLPGPVEAELVTPTGYGILKVCSKGSHPMPAMKVEKIGYGFGKKDTGSLNALRVFLGAVEEEEQVLYKAEATLDDEKGEVLGFVIAELLDAGALDAWFTPVFMKKNRPGVNLTFLCKKEDLDKLGGLLLKETSTIGYRYYPVERSVLERESITAETSLGPVRFKLSGTGAVRKVKPEFEDCRAIAQETGLSLRSVMETVLSEFNK